MTDDPFRKALETSLSQSTQLGHRSLRRSAVEKLPQILQERAKFCEVPGVSCNTPRRNPSATDEDEVRALEGDVADGSMLADDKGVVLHPIGRSTHIELDGKLLRSSMSADNIGQRWPSFEVLVRRHDVFRHLFHIAIFGDEVVQFFAYVVHRVEVARRIGCSLVSASFLCRL